MDEHDEERLRARIEQRQRGGFSPLNVLTAMALLIAVALAAVFAYLLLVPDNALARQLGLTRPTPTLVAAVEVPQVPPTDTPAAPTRPAGGGAAPATFTPAAGPIQPQAPLATLGPTLTPSVTPTFPPPTPSRTPTPTPTNTPTPGPSATATNTRSPFPFTKDATSPQYLQNFANNAGCNWLGIAGVVLDLNGQPVANGSHRVHVWDSGIDARVTVGSAPAYGPSGYEQFLFDAPRIQSHNIQLETSNGTAVSEVYRVTTRASCNQNLLYFVFIQNH